MASEATMKTIMTNVKAGEAGVGRDAKTWTVKETTAIMIEYATLPDMSMIGHCTLRNTTLCTDSHLIRNDYSNVMNYIADDDNGNGAVMSATATST